MMAKIDAQPEERRKRVQMLKRLIILSLITAILLPTVMCIILFFKIGSLKEQVEELKEGIALAQEKTAEGVEWTAGTEKLFPETVLADGQGDVSGSDAGEDTEPAGEEAENVRKVYLTFDDGPSSNTSDILDILAAYEVKATFFVVGKEGDWAEAAYQRIVEEGHTLGMHSYTHKYDEIYASEDAFSQDYYKLRDYLYEITGVTAGYYRFPGGSSNRVSEVSVRKLIAFLKEEGVEYYDWNVSSQDATGKQYTAEELVDNCMEGIERHDTVVILLHDAAGKGTTVEALPMLIERIQAMENTELLPITEDTEPVQHIKITQEEAEE